jgi:prepilin-type N-terminal cleavage/methylation domain-containing protein
MPRRLQRARGFTLLELLAVMALLGLLLFVIVPNIDNMTPAARLKAAARRIGTTMELAQGESIAAGKEFTLAYDLSKGAYWIILPAPDSTATPVPGSTPGATTSLLPGTPGSAQPNGPQPPPPDVEHDDKPLLTSSSTNGGASPPPSTSNQNFQGRETLGADFVGDDVQIASVDLPNGKESTSGIVYVNFSSLGNEGSHSVLLQLKNANGGPSGTQMAVRFNALTRTVDFGDQKLGFAGN